MCMEKLKEYRLIAGELYRPSLGTFLCLTKNLTPM